MLNEPNLKMRSIFLEKYHLITLLTPINSPNIKSTQMTPQQKQAFKYYNMGLNSKEISKLIEVSFRTIQSWIFKFNWKAKRTPPNKKLKALELVNKGMTYKTISKRFDVSEQTIYKWLRDLRN